MFAQEEVASLKDKLEQKEAEIRRLQEKLVQEVKGEEGDFPGRGERRWQPPWVGDDKLPKSLWFLSKTKSM